LASCLLKPVSMHAVAMGGAIAPTALPLWICPCQTDNHNSTPPPIFTSRCYSSAVLAVGLCLSVCLCLSQVGVLLKRLNIGSHKQHHTILQGLYFSGAKDLHEVRPGSPPTWAPNAGAVGQNRRLLTNNRKWYKIDAWFLLKPDRKSYALYRMVTLPMTLSAP